MNGRAWAESEFATLTNLLKTHLTYQEIGIILNRTAVAIQKKVTKSGLVADRIYRPKTEIHKQKVSETKKGSIPWNKGLKGITSSWNKGKKYPQILGDKNNKWKGGIRRRKEGYVGILKKDHPRATKQGYILEHILVMEKKLGRFLLKGEVVHHINNIKYDNRPENLYVFNSLSEHTKYHAELRRLKKKGDMQVYEQLKSLCINWETYKTA